MPLDLPVQVAVDRSVRYEEYLVGKRLFEDGTLVEITLTGVPGSVGGLPDDPPPWSRWKDPSTVYGHLLTGYVVALVGYYG